MNKKKAVPAELLLTRELYLLRFFTKSPVLIKNETRIAKSSRVYPLPGDSSVTGYMIPAGGGTSFGRKE